MSEADSSEKAERILADSGADLLIVDINLSGKDGLEITREQRALSEIGIILVSGRTDDVDRIVGLELGADDYVCKPFNRRELLARIKTLLRRTTAMRRMGRRVCTFEGFTFDTTSRQLRTADGAAIPLTRAEFELLRQFVSHPGAVLSRDRLALGVTHRSNDTASRTIDVLVRRLRAKLHDDPKAPRIIATSHGEGYPVGPRALCRHAGQFGCDRDDPRRLLGIAAHFGDGRDRVIDHPRLIARHLPKFHPGEEPGHRRQARNHQKGQKQFAAKAGKGVHPVQARLIFGALGMNLYRLRRQKRKIMGKALVLAWLCLATPAVAETWALQAPSVPFDYSSPSQAIAYQPLAKAAHPWHLCVSYPHLKDAYWLSVNYGMVQEAARLGVSFSLVEAGGYPNLSRQIDQIKTCVASGADALIVGTVSYDGLTPTIADIARKMPVIAAVNDVADTGISAKSGVSWREMGAAAGHLIAKLHPKGSAPVRLAWFPGAKGAGWVRFVEDGFRSALAGSSAQIVVVKYGDTGREIQVNLVEEVLDTNPDIDYLVGSGPMAEAAVSILRARGLSSKIGIVSDYMTPAVFRGIKRGKILGAPDDFPILQGELAVEQTVRAIEGSLTLRHAGPRIEIVTPDNIDAIGPGGTLAPASFVPVFELQ